MFLGKVLRLPYFLSLLMLQSLQKKIFPLIVYFSPEVAAGVLSCRMLISYSIVEYVSKPLDRPLC